MISTNKSKYGEVGSPICSFVKGKKPMALDEVILDKHGDPTFMVLLKEFEEYQKLQ
jgi:hypothetical protein